MPEPTEEQLKAINSNAESVCILACAGSGKTFTITRRIARFISELHIDPSQVAAITFTVVAADKLRLDLARLLNENQASSRMFVGTIHSFCLNLIRQLSTGDLDESQVLSDSQQFVLLNRFWNQWEIKKVDPKLGKTNLIERLVDTFSIIKMESIAPNLLQQRHPEISRVLTLYNAFLVENSLLDYSDLIAKASFLLTESAEARRRVFEKYKYIFVDEYQDVDPLQARIIALFREECRVCVVGDDDQSIYQFRGTDVRNILEFSKSLGCDTVVLSQNRRCPENILTIAEKCILKVPSRYDKSMTPITGKGLVTIKQFNKLDDEIQFVVHEIAELISQKQVQQVGDIAVLMRSVASYGQAYVNALRTATIPCVIRGGRTLFDTTEIIKIVCVLEWLIREPSAVKHLAMLRDVLSPSFDADKVNENDSQVEQLSLDEAKELGMIEADFKLLGKLCLIRESYQLNRFGDLVEIVLEVIKSLELLRKDQPESISLNVAQFTQVVQDYEIISANKKIEYLCGYLKSYAQKSFDEVVTAETARDAVNILTIHQAKGLEFDYVFVPMLVESRFPVSGGQKRWLINDDLFPAGRYYHSVENERRLYYVACTRAKKGLYLLCSRDVGLAKPKEPSIFLKESKDVVLPHENVAPSVKTERKEVIEPFVASYSSLEYYLTCPYRYKLLIKYKLATPPNPFFQFGRVIHAVIAYINSEFITKRKPTTEEVQHHYDAVFDKFLGSADIPSYVIARQKSRGLKAVRNYYTKKRTWLESVNDVESDFQYSLDECLVRGRYDLIIAYPNGKYAIIDFKTGQPHEYLRTDFQMQVYSLAAVHQLKLALEKAVLYYTEPDIEVTYNVDEVFLNNGRANLQYVVNGIASGHFEPTPGKACTRCEIRKLCEAGLEGPNTQE